MEKKKAKTQTKAKSVKKEPEFKIPVYNKKGKVVGRHTLPKEIFGAKVNEPLLNQAIRIYLNHQHKGLASTKTRGKVAGGGRKPWRQKGTGRARAGTIRSPLWRGGGVVFGPRPTQSALKFPKKMSRKAFAAVLSGKYADKAITLVDEISFREPKTKKAIQLLEKLPIENRRNILLVLKDEGESTIKSFRNLDNVATTKAMNLNTLNVLKSSGLIFTLDSMSKLKERFTNGKSQSN